MQRTKRLVRFVTGAVLALASLNAVAAAPTSDTLRAFGTDMGRAQRCNVAVSEVLLFSQLAKDLSQKGSDPGALHGDFMSAAGKAREADVADCKAAMARFDAALDELYRLNGRQR